ncbi:thrombospondin domain-containing protein [Plakobranchus ocellatus]|uniref:Thrombospondin domain-containing protein n=1 Tax=Plakobranchus ocellatus TaxID=259542 RepID=A0AAV4E053_9GAST|nr:thrombospondin domain-containing protein [Plakobranchus ocellatus]
MEVAREFSMNGMIDWEDFDFRKQWFHCVIFALPHVSTCVENVYNTVNVGMKQYGKGCANSTDQVFEKKSCLNENCPCVINGKVYESSNVHEDNCKKCECADGEFKCNITKSDDETFPNKECTHLCHCDHTGFEVCPNLLPESCKQNRDSCNPETHVLKETDNPCCPDCVPVMVPCAHHISGYATVKITHPEHGQCETEEEMAITSCGGTCGSSTVTSQRYVYTAHEVSLATESTCLCCQATMTTEVKTFLCENKAVFMKPVVSIASCNCGSCNGGD